MDATPRLITISSTAGISKTRKVGEAYQQYCDQIEAGDYVDPDVYCAQFPSFQSSLGRLLKAHDYLEDHPELLEEEFVAPWPVVGQTFLGFELLQELGQGAFARVFLAKQTALGDRLVVVKISRQGGAAEAKTLGRIQHPNVVPIHSIHVDSASAQTLVCMPYLGTATLHDVFDLLKTATVRKANGRVFQDASREREDDLPRCAGPHRTAPIAESDTYVDALREVACKIAESLAYIHEQGVCHLDLKPSNVLISPEGEPLLLDFNLSSDAQRDRLVQGGTLPYMSPEQLSYFLGHGVKTSVGPASDLFSFGVLLYELSTGCHPFGPVAIKTNNASLAQQLLDRQKSGFRPVRALNPDIDADLANLIESCLRIDPTSRPHSAADVTSQLNRQRRHLAKARRWIARNPIKLIILSLLGSVFLAGAAAALVLSPPERERQFHVAMQNYRDGNYVEAVKRFTLAIDKDPDNASAYFARGRAFQKLGRDDSTKYTMAIQDYEEARKREPNGKYAAAAGYCFQSLPGSKISAALVMYEAAEKAGVANSALFNNIAVCYDRMGGKKAEARKYLDRAVTAQPPCQAAFHNRAVFCLTLAKNHQSKLKVLAENPVVKAPFNPVMLQNEFDEAVRTARGDFEKAIEMGPLSAELLYHAALFQTLASEFDPAAKKKAIGLLRKAITDHHYLLVANDPAFASLLDDEDFHQLNLLPRPAQRQSMGIRFVDPVNDEAD